MSSDAIFADCFPMAAKESLMKAPMPRVRKAPRGPTNDEGMPKGRVVGESAAPIGQGNIGHKLLLKMVFLVFLNVLFRDGT
jgi:hypothetical protein